MANRTAWTAGNGVGLSWSTAINGSDLASLANGSTVLSSVADISNGSKLDLYGDGSLSSGGTVTRALPFAPVGIVPIANATLTLLAGLGPGILIMSGSFRL